MAGNTIRILITDDEPSVRDSLGCWFREQGYAVDTAASGRETLEKLAKGRWDIFLLDIRMPEMDGLELQKKVASIDPQAAIILMTAFASVDTAVEAMRQGAYDYVVKPIDPEDLEHIIRNAAERRSLLSENVLLKQQIDEIANLHEIIGSSAAMRRVLQQVAVVSRADTTILIRGESGTGKEMIARAIHSSSPRRYAPIVVVSCGALSEGVLESELFGHERGAFTGAQFRRKGKFEMASGGTLFLDEIGDISAKTQVDLLRVLEEKKISRVGGNEVIPVDFRLLAATNKNLEAMMQAGKFREDLYYRLNVFAVTLPPLRDRREDIPLLANHFLKRHCLAMNRRVPVISREAIGLLTEHDWPGNVRELQNAIERSLLVNQGPKIIPADFPLNRTGGQSTVGAKSLGVVEEQHIRHILDEASWNISLAARWLQIDRVTLYHKIKKYHISRDVARGA